MPYIVQTASTTPADNCWGTYRRVAVLEVAPGVTAVKMISSRARGVRRVVQTWENCHKGSTERCAYRRALAAARDLAARLKLREKLPGGYTGHFARRGDKLIRVAR